MTSTRAIARASVAVLVAGALAVLTAACASVPRTPGERRDERLDALEQRVLDLSRQAAVADVELQRLRQEVATLQARLQAQGSAAVTRPAPAAAAPRANDSVGATRPSRPAPSAAAKPKPRAASALEESELPDEEPAPTVATVTAPRPPATATTKPPIAAPKPAPAPAAGSPPAAAVPAPAAAAPAPASGEGGAVPRDAQVVYDEAYTLYHQGKYDEAEARFEEFLAQAPRTELSDNAEYWIGAARFERKDFKGALAAFRKTVELYPDANKVPDALYKMGQCLEALDQPKQAIDVYDELTKRFPDTAAGTLAAERRAKLRP